MHGRCRSPSFLKPLHFVTLAHVIRREGMINLSLPEHLQQYASRMHLWDAIGMPAPVSVRELNACGRFVPLEPLRDKHAVHDCAQRLAGITSSARLSASGVDSLATAISELLDNCFAHSGAEDGFFGLVCAQYWRKANLLQIAISDTGVGIRANLLQADTLRIRERAQEMNCCELATQLHASSKLQNGHAGYGLALARQLAEQNGGALLLASGHEYFRSVEGVVQSGVTERPWTGTLVIVEFNTGAQLDIGSIYKSWPPVRGYEDADFDF